MQKLGLLIGICGLLATLLYGLDMQPSFLSILDHWGENIGIAVRLSMIPLGIVLLFIGRTKNKLHHLDHSKAPGK